MITFIHSSNNACDTVILTNPYASTDWKHRRPTPKIYNLKIIAKNNHVLEDTEQTVNEDTTDLGGQTDLRWGITFMCYLQQYTKMNSRG